jgi:hypothetical protein
VGQFSLPVFAAVAYPVAYTPPAALDENEERCPKVFESKAHFVALSTADSNKWLLLKEGHLEKQAPEVITSSDYRLNGSIRQRQRRLTGAQVVEMAAKYKAGATVYELSAEFGCHRATVAERLKKAGIMMRGQSPNPEEIDSMARLVASGLAPEAVGKQLGFCANTVRNCLRGRHSMQ